MALAAMDMDISNLLGPTDILREFSLTCPPPSRSSHVVVESNIQLGSEQRWKSMGDLRRIPPIISEIDELGTLISTCNATNPNYRDVPMLGSPLKKQTLQEFSDKMASRSPSHRNQQQGRGSRRVSLGSLNKGKYSSMPDLSSIRAAGRRSSGSNFPISPQGLRRRGVSDPGSTPLKLRCLPQSFFHEPAMLSRNSSVRSPATEPEPLFKSLSMSDISGNSIPEEASSLDREVRMSGPADTNLLFKLFENNKHTRDISPRRRSLEHEFTPTPPTISVTAGLHINDMPLCNDNHSCCSENSEEGNDGLEMPIEMPIIDFSLAPRLDALTLDNADLPSLLSDLVDRLG